jgi:glycosyltransferase involved in cell wall biosynthesis
MKSGNKRVIIVLGMHRGGTSAIARSLQVLGVGLGDNLYPPADDNPTGFWEDRDCIAINEELLGYVGSEYDRLGLAWNFNVTDPLISHLYHTAIQFVSKSIVKTQGVWGLKDPRMSRLLGFWKEVFKACDCNVSYVISVRDPVSVAESLEKRNHIASVKSHFLWLQHMVPAILGSADGERVVISYDSLLNAPRDQLVRIADCLKLPFNENNNALLKDFSEKFLDNKLRHSNHTLSEICSDSSLPSDALKAYELLLRVAADEISIDSDEVQSAFIKIQSNLKAYAPAFTYANLLELEIERLSPYHPVSGRHERFISLPQYKNFGKVQLMLVLAEREAQIANLSAELSGKRKSAPTFTNQMAVMRQSVKILSAQVAEIKNSRLLLKNTSLLFRKLRVFISSIPFNRKVKQELAYSPDVVQAEGDDLATRHLHNGDFESCVAQPDQVVLSESLHRDSVEYKPASESYLLGNEQNDPPNDRKYKIVLVVHQFVPDYSSGTEVLTYETAKALQKLGHDVIVFTGFPAIGKLKDSERFDRYIHDGIHVERFRHNYEPMGDQSNVMEMGYNNKLFGSYFREFLNYEKPDLVHFFHLLRLSASTIDVCNELRIPTVLTPTDFWLICHFSQLRWPGNQLCPGPDKYAVNCLRHVVANHQSTRIDALFQKLPDWLIAVLIFSIKYGLNFDRKYSPTIRALANRGEFLRARMNRVDKITIPTRVMMTNLIQNGLEDQRTISLPYGLNPLDFQDAKRPEPSNILRLGYIGTLSEYKGVHVLVEAIKKLAGRPVELNIYGNLNYFPDYVERIRRIVQEDPRVKFCGTFPNREIGKIFSDLDVLVVPSLWHENAPLVIYSAQAARCPVIASNMDGMSEVIEHGKNGLLFEAGNVNELVTTIEALLDDNGLLQKLSDNARKPLAILEYALKLQEIYRNLIAKDRSI